MGGFNPPVPQQDNNWEIRVALLLSLLFQVLLLFVGPMRKRCSSPVISFAIWSCYLLADWVADLALGLLLNNMGNIGGNGGGSFSTGTGGGASSPIIFAFWAPFLLLHLGGQDTMTAYSIQDNDLWRRHLVGLLFELLSAGVIFYCSMQGNPMIPATVLMFVAGIIKYGERTYSLYSGSIDSVLPVITGPPNPGPNYAKLMTEFSSKEKAGLMVDIVIANGEAKNVQEALGEGEIVRYVKGIRSLELQAYEFYLDFRKLCFDVALSYKELKTSLAYFLDNEYMTATRAFQVIEVEFNFVYDMVHTKQPIAHTTVGCILRFVGSGCILSALAFFLLLDKGSIQRVDVGITYALLLGGLALDVAALAMLLFSGWTLVFLERTPPRLAWLTRAIRRLRLRLRRWKEKTSQLNLIDYCLGKPGPSGGGGRCRWRIYFACRRVIRALAKKLGMTPIFDHFFSNKLSVAQRFDDLFFTRHEPLRSRQEAEPLLLKFIFDKLRERARNARRMEYEDMKNTWLYRGEGVLVNLRNKDITEKLKQQEAAKPAYKEIEEDGIDKLVKEKVDVLVGSIRRQFDESLLLWHIATDLCSSPYPDPLPGSKPDSSSTECGNNKLMSKTLSEYMLYLLIKQPKVLLASAGFGLQTYQDTCAEARRFFESAAVWDPNHEDAKKMLLDVNTTKYPSEVKGDRSKSVLFDAVIVAKVLRELGEGLMWEVVANVWGEMLTYAASKCRGSVHVRQLAHGGELITMVWFLMAHMGLSDMYQIQEGDTNARLLVHY